MSDMEKTQHCTLCQGWFIPDMMTLVCADLPEPFNQRIYAPVCRDCAEAMYKATSLSIGFTSADIPKEDNPS